MKMYDFTLAPSSRRVRIFLAENGIEVDLVQVDIMRNANRTPEFCKKNPFGSLPILELDDGSCLSESVAIATTSRKSGRNRRCSVWARARKRSSRCGIEGSSSKSLRPVGHVWSHLSKVSEGRGRRILEFGEIQKRAAIERIAWLDSELENREFIARDRYSIADITTLCMIDFARTVDIRIQPEQTNLARWYSNIASRPSAKA